MVATPLVLTTAFPVSKPPDTSAALMPDRVYGTAVPEAILVVVNVKLTVSPSLIEVAEETKDKVELLVVSSKLTVKLPVLELS